MAQDNDLRIAILYPGDREARRNATSENNRFAELFKAFTAQGIWVEPAVYNDEFYEEVREQLMRLDGALVWCNPIEGGRDRAVLDAMLRDLAAAGKFVSTHPDVILKLGTKEVLSPTPRYLNPFFASATHNAGAAKRKSRWTHSFSVVSSTLSGTAG